MKQYNATINYETLSWDATVALIKLDETFIGTKNYMGIGYFWDREYKHYLRESTIASRKKVHEKLLEAGLSVDGKSDVHLEIVRRYSRIPKCKFGH